MALGKKRLGAAKSSPNSNGNVVGDDDRGLGLDLEIVKYKRGIGKNKILISGRKNRDSRKVSKKTLQKSRKLETLPQDILVRIICGVEHEDLKQLFNVSKTIREATLIAKKWHFENSTPRKTLFFRGGIDSIDLEDDTKAPSLKRCHRSRTICDKKASKISMALFK